MKKNNALVPRNSIPRSRNICVAILNQSPYSQYKIQKNKLHKWRGSEQNNRLCNSQNLVEVFPP